MRSWTHRALDRSVLFSFDRTGFARHARRFGTLQPPAPPGAALITGGTAGIGYAVAQALADTGWTTTLWGRSAERGQAATAALPGARFAPVDLGDLERVSKAAHAADAPLDVIVLNAGSMPLEPTVSPQGHEAMWASQLLGHLLLLRILRRRGQLTERARVIWVSSGGMYTQALELPSEGRTRRYQRHSVYANVKRAQVMLARHLAARWPDIWSGSMHPGWVDTAAVRHSMPWFHRCTAPLLRSPAQGADTITWLAGQEASPPTGRFWFDRTQQAEHVWPWTRRSEHQLDALVEHVFHATEPYLSHRSPP